MDRASEQSGLYVRCGIVERTEPWPNGSNYGGGHGYLQLLKSINYFICINLMDLGKLKALQSKNKKQTLAMVFIQTKLKPTIERNVTLSGASRKCSPGDLNEN